jgi:methylthioribulose-1-phosphate dehydratase
MSTTNILDALTQTVLLYHAKGWSPATSTNYSFRENDCIWVSRSGVDKSAFQTSDFIEVDLNGIPTAQFAHVKPSAETLIHCAIYVLFPDTKVILHSHSKSPIILAEKQGNDLMFTGYEVQKGFEGVDDHKDIVRIPVFENTQDMQAFREELIATADQLKHHSFVMRKHGVYAWGRNLLEAKRHLESLDYLCDCELKIKY